MFLKLHLVGLYSKASEHVSFFVMLICCDEAWLSLYLCIMLSSFSRTMPQEQMLKFNILSKYLLSLSTEKETYSFIVVNYPWDFSEAIVKCFFTV